MRPTVTDNNKIYIIDGHNFFFRAFYAIRGMKNAKMPTNAIYGFVRSILKLIKNYSPTHMVIVFDGPDNEKSRTDIYSEYKANRDKMPEDLYLQLPYVYQFCENFGIPFIISKGVEADDVIGTLAKEFSKNQRKTFMCSSDKDLCQLVDNYIFLLNISKDNLLVNKEKVEEIYSISPHQFIDYLALVGDSSDNIPGVHGIGPKAASKLLTEFNSLEGIYQSIDQISSKGQVEKLINKKKEAFLSKQLATIDLAIPIDKTIDSYALKKPNSESLKKFYEEMEFNTLLQGLKADEPPSKTPTINYTLVDSQEEIARFEKTIHNVKEITFSIITDKAIFMEAIPKGIAISINPHNHFFLLISPLTLKPLKRLFTEKNSTLQGHNIKLALHHLANIDIHPTCPFFDIMIASYLLDSSSPNHSLEKLGLPDLPDSLDAKEIACLKANHVRQQSPLLKKELKKKNLEKLFLDMEMPLVPILFQMERSGIFIDKTQLQDLSCTYHKQLKLLTEEIYSYAEEEFNINSPKQLSKILFTKLEITPPKQKRKSTSFSTNIEVLKSLKKENPIIQSIIEYRSLSKLLSTYIDALPKQINPKTHKIHPTFQQTGTATGRLSCSDPNLQNIPIRTKDGNAIRSCFKSYKHNQIFCAMDYSQIELRILAHMSGDKLLMDAFMQDEDIHKSTASVIFDLPLNKVTQQMRSKAKTVNFALLYGQQAFSLSKELEISVKEAKQFITTYFEKYPKISDFLEECKAKAKKEMMAESLFGRQRSLPDINSSNKMLLNAAYRLAINSPIQSTGADIIKFAMIRIAQSVLKKHPKVSLILQIHDELIFEGEEKALHKASQELKDAMENAVQLKVPLKVDISFGLNWGNML